MNQEGLRKFVELMRARVIGQRMALEEIDSAISRAGTSRQPGSPLAVLLFVGGVGLGKGTAAHGMAEVLFGNEASCKEVPVGEQLERGIIQALSEGPGVIFLRNADDANERTRTELTSILKRLRSGPPLATHDGESASLNDSVFVVSLRAKLPLELTLPGNSPSQEFLQGWLAGQFNKQFSLSFFQSFDAIIPFKHFDVATKVRLAEKKISELARREAAAGRSLRVDNSVSAYIGSRARDESGALDVQRAFDEYVGTPTGQAVTKYEATGKRNLELRIHVVEDRIHISIE